MSSSTSAGLRRCVVDGRLVGGRGEAQGCDRQARKGFVPFSPPPFAGEVLLPCSHVFGE